MSQRSRTNPEREVLIVGAGPTGMVTASELQRYGMQCRIIDRLPQPSHTSKALGIQARTLELFEKMGIVESFLAKGVKLTARHSYIGFRCHPVSLEQFWAYLDNIFVPSQAPSTSTATRSKVESRR